MPPQSFVRSIRRALVPVGLGLAIAGAGGYLLAARREAAVAWVSLASGLVLALWFALGPWRRAPVLWFDDAGLRARLPGFGCVAWSDIEAVRLARVRGRAFLIVERAAAARQAAVAWPVLRMLAKMANAADLAVPIDGLSASPEQVVAVVELARVAARA
ncbi:MAG TPA: hypothetical protein VFZ65_14375 [Planctomycetota bacterium]|nr:hypothetical protein [Planctomycetota bacterium]